MATHHRRQVAYHSVAVLCRPRFSLFVQARFTASAMRPIPCRVKTTARTPPLQPQSLEVPCRAARAHPACAKTGSRSHLPLDQHMMKTTRQQETPTKLLLPRCCHRGIAQGASRAVRSTAHRDCHSPFNSSHPHRFPTWASCAATLPRPHIGLTVGQRPGTLTRP